ncbi:stAR-related lipid transfer protein 6-like [Saccoglossus kowalevskii]|uniref:StAR-related lipid transfer protein 6-like n=1 Tax=Saccoglossus kowalevskii TaxID=10224 RepID=A0ABM0GRW7_SACKO|nr:PREDICTED: stAR-related lipid transfer protein 6-like [Saccoglossus kowalevskii]
MTYTFRMSQYRSIAEDTLLRVEEYARSDGWKPCKTSRGLTITCKDSLDFHGKVYRSTYELAASPERALDLIWDLEKHMKWHESVDRMGCIETIDEDLKVIRTVSVPYLKGLISPREFIDVIGYKRYQERNLLILYWKGVEHDDYRKPTRGCVRGVTYPSAMFLYAVDGQPQRSRCVQILQLDGHTWPRAITDRALTIFQTNGYDDLVKAIDSQPDDDASL